MPLLELYGKNQNGEIETRAITGNSSGGCSAVLQCQL